MLHRMVVFDNLSLFCSPGAQTRHKAYCESPLSVARAICFEELACIFASSGAFTIYTLAKKLGFIVKVSRKSCKKSDNLHTLVKNRSFYCQGVPKNRSHPLPVHQNGDSVDKHVLQPTCFHQNGDSVDKAVR